MNTLTVILFTAGPGSLIAGAKALVKGASRPAAVVGISALLIGLTVAAFGTSAPELAVGLFSSLNGQADMAVGSNAMAWFVFLLAALVLAISPLRDLRARRGVTKPASS